MADTVWQPVNRDHPCLVCGKPDFCATGDGGEVLRCMREGSAPSGYKRLKANLDGGVVYGLEHRNGHGRHHPTGNGHAKPAPTPAPDLQGVMDKARQALTDKRLAELAQATGVPAEAWRLLQPGWVEGDDLRALKARWEGPYPSGAWTFAEFSGDGQLIGVSLRAVDGRKSSAKGGKRGLAVPRDIANRPDPVLIVEGASDVAAAMAMGLCAVGRPMAKGGVADLAKLLTGRDVLVLGERDGKADGSWPGLAGAKFIAGKLASAWSRPVRWALPPDDAKDVRQFYIANAGENPVGAGQRLLQDLLAGAQTIEPPEPVAEVLDARDADDDRPDVLTPGGHTDSDERYSEVSNPQFTSAVIDTLPQEAVYRRGGIAGEIVDGRFVPMTVDRARLVVDAHARLIQWTQTREGVRVTRYAPTNRNHAGLFLTSAGTDRRVRNIDLITPHPVYTGHDFTLSEPGWSNGVYYCEPDTLKEMEPEFDASAIRDTFDDLLTDFPFKDEADRHNFIGMMFTPLIRPALRGNTPMFHIGASLERTGKTKLVEVVWGGIVTGRGVPAMQFSARDEENDKRILALLLSGASIVHLDNLRDFTDSAALASLLTAEVYTGRVLGHSQMVELPNTLTVASTGNNIRFTGELAKRIVPITLQPQTDSPESRSDFAHPDLPDYIAKVRRNVWTCLLGAVEIWKRAGRPKGRFRMGGFEDWAVTIGGIMGVVGWHDWMSNYATWARASDPNAEDLRIFVDAWARLYQTNAVSPQSLLNVADEANCFPLVFKSPTEKGRVTSLGMRVLNKYVDTPVGTWFIRRMTSGTSGMFYLECAQ